MKCGKMDCHKHRAPGQKYCSANHAPYAHLAGTFGEKRTQSDQATEKSSQEEPGGRSRQFYRTALMIAPEPKMESVGPPSGSLGVSEIQNTKSAAIENQPNENGETENITGDSGMPGTNETKNDTASSSVPAATDETLPAVSPLSPTNLEEARYRSMSLIDDTAKHLLGYMKSLGKNCTANPVLRDYRTANAVANLAKQIAQLAKVKLDAIKEGRK